MTIYSQGIRHVTSPPAAEFLAFFAAGDVASAKCWLVDHPELAEHDGVGAHPLLRRCVESNNGQCHKASHVRIADLLTPTDVTALRAAVLDDDDTTVARLLATSTNLVHAEFAGGRGIAQAIHHWSRPRLGALLLGEGANLEAVNTLGETPLAMQLRFGSLDAVRFLLDQGADPNHGPCVHMPSDTLAERIEVLLAHGWQIGHGQLHHDAKHGFGARIRVWLQYGVDPNAQDDSGRTALHLVAAKGTGREAIGALLDAGADVHALDAKGKSPLEIARFAPRQVALRVLCDRIE